MTLSPLARRIRRLERRGAYADIPWRLFDFRTGDPVLEALGGREMTTAEWLEWARPKPPSSSENS